MWGESWAGPETVDGFAERIWREMQAKERARRAATSATLASHRAREREERERAAAEAAGRSRRILEEEQQKEQSWREAVAQVLVAGMALRKS